MTIHREVQGDVQVLRLAGRITIEDADDLDAYLADVVASGPRKVVVDCAGIEHIVSAIVGSFLGLREKLRAQAGDAALADCSVSMRRIAHQMDLRRFFVFHADVATATRALGAVTTNGR